MFPFIKFINHVQSPVQLSNSGNVMDFYHGYNTVEKAVFLLRQSFMLQYLIYTTSADHNKSVIAYLAWVLKEIFREEDRVKHRSAIDPHQLELDALAQAHALLTPGDSASYDLMTINRFMIDWDHIPGRVSSNIYTPQLMHRHFRHFDNNPSSRLCMPDGILMFPCSANPGRVVHMISGPVFNFTFDRNQRSEQGIKFATSMLDFVSCFHPKNVTLTALIERVSRLSFSVEEPTLFELLAEVLKRHRGCRKVNYSNIAANAQYHIQYQSLADLVALILVRCSTGELEIDDPSLLRLFAASISGYPKIVGPLLELLNNVNEAVSYDDERNKFKGIVADIQSNTRKENVFCVDGKFINNENRFSTKSNPMISDIESMIFDRGFVANNDGLVMAESDYEFDDPPEEESEEETPEDTEDTSEVPVEGDEETEESDEEAPDEQDEEAVDDVESEGEVPEEGTESEPEESDTDEQAYESVSKLLGFEFVLSKDSSLNSVMFKQMVDSSITEILQNTESGLSVDTQKALRYFQLHWLYLVDSETIKQVLSKLLVGKQNTLKKVI